MASQVRHPKEYREHKVREWLLSGKNARVWCSEHQVPYSTFLAWRKRLESEESQQLPAVSLANSLPQESWEKMIQEWLVSGKSAKAWCIAHRLPYRAFLSWKKRLKVLQELSYKSPPPLASPSPGHPCFVELTDSPNTASGIYLECANVKIHLSNAFDSLTLSRCLNIIRGGAC